MNVVYHLTDSDGNEQKGNEQQCDEIFDPNNQNVSESNNQNGYDSREEHKYDYKALKCVTALTSAINITSTSMFELAEVQASAVNAHQE